MPGGVRGEFDRSSVMALYLPGSCVLDHIRFCKEAFAVIYNNFT